MQAGDRIVIAPVMGSFGGVAVVCALAMAREAEITRTKGKVKGDRDELRRWGPWMRFWLSVHLRRRDPGGEEWDSGVKKGGVLL